jgi:hypothetical protein
VLNAVTVLLGRSSATEGAVNMVKIRQYFAKTLEMKQRQAEHGAPLSEPNVMAELWAELRDANPEARSSNVSKDPGSRALASMIPSPATTSSHGDTYLCFASRSSSSCYISIIRLTFNI